MRSIIHCFVRLALLWLFMASKAYALPANAEAPASIKHHEATSVNPQVQAPRDSLVKAIQEQARHDITSDNAKQRVSELNMLFGDRAKASGVSMQEALLVYEQAYSDALKSKPWWEKLQPNTSVIIAVIIAISGIFWNTIKDYLSRFFKWSIELLYNRLAGYKPFWWFALRRYRRHLVSIYQELKIPFRPDRPLKMEEVYVPLKVSGTGAHDLVDAYKTVAKYRRLMIVGTPGSGKSMLLKNISLTYAQEELNHFDDHTIPVLLELHRLNDASLSLFDQLKNVLDRNDFPHADAFITNGLKRGSLLLLFDGLDEVNSDRRNDVVLEIKDLLDQYSDCRSLITCRLTVYKGEFDEKAEQKLEIVEFNDEQIQRFLNSWHNELPADKSIAHLLQNLYERPNIMALARNPLLLTIIAYLYADTAFVLPHSRAEFYKKATDFLLEQWKGERNQYKAVHKQLVLQHLALYNQDNPSQNTQDRRSIDLPVVLAEIKTVLPKLNLKDEIAESLLVEIVERSGLLIKIDGGTKYQFTHLTLQEFYAAQALEGHDNELFALFKDDPDKWRETIKLWCGSKQDSTNLIRKIYDHDPVTAIEALGDAMQVDDDLANDIITGFKQRLGEDGDAGEAMMRALAAVAVDPRPRGEQLLSFLTEKLTVDDPKLRLAAANVLALSNLPKAADTLAEYVHEQPDLQASLVQMGNLAVSALAKWAINGEIWALDGLQLIGTPEAAKALVDVMWYGCDPVPYQVAWRLATLLHKPGVETILREQKITPEQRSSATLDWVWEPFEEDNNAPIRAIAGRIAYLLHTSPDNAIPSGSPSEMDPRIVIPVCSVAAQENGKLKPVDNSLREVDFSEWKKRISGAEDTEKRMSELLTDENLDKVSNDRNWRYLFGGMNRLLQYNLFERMVSSKTTPSVDDWRNIGRPVDYKFESSWQARGIKLTLLILMALGVGGFVSTINQTLKILSWENGLRELMVLLPMIVTFWLWEQGELKGTFFDLDMIEIFSVFIWITFVPIFGYTISRVFGNLIIGEIAGGILGAILFATFLIFTVSAKKILTYVTAGMSGTVFGLIFASISISLISITSVLIFTIIISLITCFIFYWFTEKNILVASLYGALYASSYLFIFLPTELLLSRYGWMWAMFFWLVCLGLITTLYLIAKRRERAAQNPLRGLLELSAQQTANISKGRKSRLLNALWLKR